MRIGLIYCGTILLLMAFQVCATSGIQPSFSTKAFAEKAILGGDAAILKTF